MKNQPTPIVEYGRTLVITKRSQTGRLLDFVARAVSSDIYRPFMMSLFCDGDRIYGTDGRRVHWINIGDSNLSSWFSADMLYEPIKANRLTIILAEKPNGEGSNVFQNVKRVFPDGEPSTSFDFQGIGGHPSESSLEMIRFFRKASGYINVEYLREVGRPIDGEWSVSWYEDKHVYQFENEKQGALIMSMSPPQARYAV